MRIQLTKDQTRLKNRIKSLLNFLGVHLPENIELKHWSGGFIVYLHKLEFKHEPIKQTLEQLLKQLSILRTQLSDVLKLLRKSVKQNEKTEKIISHLLSVPGVGFITAITLYTERTPKKYTHRSCMGISKKRPGYSNGIWKTFKTNEETRSNYSHSKEIT